MLGNINSIANKIGISHKTSGSYLEDLEDLFIVKIVHHKGKRVNYRKEKKIFIRGPFLAKSLGLWCDKELRKDFLFESVVQEHLFRRFGEIYYYRNTNNLRVEVKTPCRWGKF